MLSEARLYYNCVDEVGIHHLHMGNNSGKVWSSVCVSKRVGNHDFAVGKTTESEWTVAELVELLSVDKSALLAMVRAAKVASAAEPKEASDGVDCGA